MGYAAFCAAKGPGVRGMGEEAALNCIQVAATGAGGVRHPETPFPPYSDPVFRPKTGVFGRWGAPEGGPIP